VAVDTTLEETIDRDYNPGEICPLLFLSARVGDASITLPSMRDLAHLKKKEKKKEREGEREKERGKEKRYSRIIAKSANFFQMRIPQLGIPRVLLLALSNHSHETSEGLLEESDLYSHDNRIQRERNKRDREDISQRIRSAGNSLRRQLGSQAESRTW